MPSFVYFTGGTISAIFPLLVSLNASVLLALPSIIAELTAKLAALVDVKVRLPAIALSAALLLGIGIALPSVSFVFSVSLIAQMTLRIGILNALIALVAKVGLLLPNAGMQVATYSGLLTSLGNSLADGTPIAVPANIAIPGTSVFAVVILVDLANAGSVAALKQVIKLG